MECTECKKSRWNNVSGNCCGDLSQGNCNFEPIEKEPVRKGFGEGKKRHNCTTCDFIKKCPPEDHYLGCKRWSNHSKRKEETMKAEDYKMIKAISLSDITRDGACDEAIIYYVKKIFNKLSTGGKTILEKVIEDHPEWLPWLIEQNYIKKIERKPVVGDVWELGGNLWFVAENEIMESTPVKSTRWLCYRVADSDKTFMNFQANGWKYIGKLSDMLKDKP